MKKTQTISVIGLGYVGLPLAVAFARHTKVIGFDTNQRLIRDFKNGRDHHLGFGKKELQQKNLFFTYRSQDLKQASFHIIAVPTPIHATHEPDLDMIYAATRTVGAYLKKKDIVVYESTVYPGLTEEECVPILEQVSGLKCGKDFFVGYSPERINPGDRKHTLENTVKIVSAQDRRTLELIAATYAMVVKAGIHRVSSIRVAEAAKVIENTQRDINIALMNELALIFEKMQIDSTDVLEAAGTKWNFLKFQPGLVGGHCIGVDPYYLTHKAIQVGYSPRVILSGRSINDSMGLHVARRVVKQMIKQGVVVKNSVVSILGFTFKENIADVRNTRVLDIVNELHSYDIQVQVCDPYADADEVWREYQLKLQDMKNMQKSDAVILAVTHTEFVRGGWPMIRKLLKKGTGVVFDVKSILSREKQPDGIVLQRL